ncbi:MAG: SDR family oxidoreductase, partial [Bacilli bacterium]|nr:SDR family oxidoreductase [Bacilli bacterium]
MKKIALVTGASRGIGRSIAVKFLEEGYIVYGTFFESEERINELVNKYGKDNFKKIGPYNFSRTEDSFKLVEDVAGIEFDTLVLNAGTFSENDDFVNFDLDEFNNVMNCNFYSQLIIATKLQNYIKNDGNLVLMASNDAYSGAFGSMSYSISKSAVVSLMKCLC